MMHKIKKLVSGLCVTAMFAASLSASVVLAENEQVGTSGIYLWGSTDCKESGKIITFDVWAHDKDADDLRAAQARENYPDILVYKDEFTSGENGAYEVSFGLGGRPSGPYDAYIACSCGETIKKETIIFSNPAENITAIGLLNTAARDNEGDAAITEIQRVCSDNIYALGFVSDYTLDGYAAGLIDSHIDALIEDNGVGLDVNDKEAAIKMYKKLVAISAIKSGVLTNLFDAANDLLLPDGRLATLYNKDFVTNDFGVYTTNKLKDSTFTTLAGFDEELYKQFVFSTVKKADGYGNIQDTISVFKSDIGLNREATAQECLRVMTKEYTSYETLLSDMLSGTTPPQNQNGDNNSPLIGDGVKYSDAYVPSAPADTINKNIFNDIDSVPWATEAIVELAQKGIISGKGDGLFCPDDNITREEFVKIIMLTFFKDAKPADISFNDVDDSAWYAEYVKMAYGENIINGIGDGLFGTGVSITREDMAVIAYRTAVKAGRLTEDNVAEKEFIFADDESISEYAKTSVYALYEADVINGMNELEFAPKPALTRAQAAKIIYGIYTLR